MQDKNTVVVKSIQERKAAVYNPEGVFLGCVTNELEMMDVRLQIKRLGLSGYYFDAQDSDGEYHKIEIYSNGVLSEYPKGFFDMGEKMLTELIIW